MTFTDFEAVAPPSFLPELSTIRQGSEMTMIALGVGEHPPALDFGNHLRWSFDPRLGFPERGFALWRRPHVEPSLQIFSFAQETRRTLSRVESFGAFRWLSGHAPYFQTATIERSENDPANSNMLFPGMDVNTCAFDAALGAVRRIVIELVHAYFGPPTTLTVWGTYKQRRVADDSVVISTVTRAVPLTLTIDADALDGFQFDSGPWGILSIGYALVSWDAARGWMPIGPDSIGLPVTAPRYRVTHKHSTDAGLTDAERDWLEAADRMSPTGQAADLPAVITNRFGPPEFDNTRSLMRDALARRPIAVAEQNERPAVEIDPIRLLLTAAIDPQVATMLGLLWIDRTAEPGVIYDYRIAGIWHEPLKPFSPERLLVPGEGLTLNVNVPYETRTLRGFGLTIESKSTGGSPEGWPTVRLVRDLEADFPTDALRGLRIRQRDGGTLAPRVRDVDAAQQRRLFEVRLNQPVTRVTVLAKGGEAPWAVLAVSGDEVVAAAAVERGSVKLELAGARIDSLWIGGATLRVGQIDLQPEAPPVRVREWICYNVVRGPVPTIQPPVISGETVPGFARATRPEQMVALFLEPEALPPASGFFPLARSGHEPVSFDMLRRTDGNAPVAGIEGNWTILNLDEDGLVDPIIPGRNRPSLLVQPDDWPPDPPHFFDTTIDPAVRWYSYRARGRDLFGRTSPLSEVLHVDAADRWGPPLPADVRARWIELRDPRTTADDAALLNNLNEPFAIRVQWEWPENLRAQAPDTASFRIYWNSQPFEEYLLAEIQEVLNATAPDTYRVRVVLPRNPPLDAFAGDWLRQGNDQYLITGSSAANPSVMTLTRGVSPFPSIGDCSVSLRAPAGLDQLGNPLRGNAASPLSWGERVLQGPLLSIRTNVDDVSAGAMVQVVQARIDLPRPNLATLELATTFRWDEPDLASWSVTTEAEIYPVLGGTLGAHAAVLVIDIEGRQPPAPGLVTLQNAAETLATLSTALLEAQFPNAAPFVLRGGIAALDPIAPVGPIAGPDDVPPAPRTQVLGYRTNPQLEIIVARISAVARVRWWPGYEAVVTNHELAVSDRRTSAIGVAGVSAVDDRAYQQDLRVRANEPNAPGNEGPIQAARVRRAYFGRPDVQAQPDGVVGPDPLWAPEPEVFSGISRFPLRWSTAGATRFHVAHATFNAVLDVDVAARRARRGLYVGARQLDDAGLVAHRSQQAALDAQGQRALAAEYPEAFADLTTNPVAATDARWSRGQPAGRLRWFAPLDGKAPGSHFLRVIAVDAAGNRGDPGPVTLPIIVPDVHQPVVPVLRRAIAGDRCVWLNWTSDSNGADGYRIYRVEASSNPDLPLSSMQLVATRPANAAPAPLPVVRGRVILPNPPWNAPAVVFLAQNYDPDSPPDAQAAVPVAGGVFDGATITELDLRDGTLVYVVAMSADNVATLVRSPTEHAYCDQTAAPHVKYFYRITAFRNAMITAARSRAIASQPSRVVSEAAYDGSRPQPPQGTTLTWDAITEAVVITWPTVGIPPETSVCVQKFDPGFLVWQSVSPWLPAATGRYDNTRVRRGTEESYRLRVRDARERVSDDEPAIGSVVIP